MHLERGGSSRSGEVAGAGTLLVAGRVLPPLLLRGLPCLWARLLGPCSYLRRTLRPLLFFFLQLVFLWLEEPAYVGLREQENHLLLVECRVGHISDRVVVLDGALVQLDQFGELYPSLVDPEFLHDDVLLEVVGQVLPVACEPPQALRLREHAWCHK